MISWLFNDLFVTGGELRQRAIRDSLKVTQEFSGRAGDRSQRFLPVVQPHAALLSLLWTGASARKLHPRDDRLQVVVCTVSGG